MAHSNASRGVRRFLDNALTVEELLDILQDCDGDTKVIFKCDYGDIGHTQQALAVTSVELLYDSGCKLEESGYSLSGVAIEEVDPDGDEEPDDLDVIVLS